MSNNQTYEEVLQERERRWNALFERYATITKDEEEDVLKVDDLGMTRHEKRKSVNTSKNTLGEENNGSVSIETKKLDLLCMLVYAYNSKKFIDDINKEILDVVVKEKSKFHLLFWIDEMNSFLKNPERKTSNRELLMEGTRLKACLGKESFETYTLHIFNVFNYILDYIFANVNDGMTLTDLWDDFKKSLN